MTQLTETKTQELKSAYNRYLELKAQIDSLEEELKTHKNVIEEAVVMFGKDDTLQIDDMVASITAVTRENFKLKEAREKLDLEALMKFITPYVSTTDFTQLRVKIVKAKAA